MKNALVILLLSACITGTVHSKNFSLPTNYQDDTLTVLYFHEPVNGIEALLKDSILMTEKKGVASNCSITLFKDNRFSLYYEADFENISLAQPDSTGNIISVDMVKFAPYYIKGTWSQNTKGTNLNLILQDNLKLTYKRSSPGDKEVLLQLKKSRSFDIAREILLVIPKKNSNNILLKKM